MVNRYQTPLVADLLEAGSLSTQLSIKTKGHDPGDSTEDSSNHLADQIAMWVAKEGTPYPYVSESPIYLMFSNFSLSCDSLDIAFL